jgi:hypothetical protein
MCQVGGRVNDFHSSLDLNASHCVRWRASGVGQEKGQNKEPAGWVVRLRSVCRSSVLHSKIFANMLRLFIRMSVDEMVPISC